MIFTVEERHALQCCLDAANYGSAVHVPERVRRTAEAAFLKVHANTAWDTDPALDVHKEPKPCPKS